MNDTAWRQLCEDIMKERDPERLMNLVEQLNQLLEQRESELRHHNRPQPKVE